MKIVYTDSARKELERFYDAQRELLEDAIKKEKFVFGDDQLEITASDIKEASHDFTVRDRSSYRVRRLKFTTIALRLYAVMGILLALVGLFYPYFRNLFEENPSQLSMVIAGVATSLFSILMMYFLRHRTEYHRTLLDIKSREMERRLADYQTVQSGIHFSEVDRMEELERIRKRIDELQRSLSSQSHDSENTRKANRVPGSD